MRVPITPQSSTNQPNPTPKPVSGNTSFHGLPNSNNYEPSSVLELRCTPSPMLEKPAGIDAGGGGVAAAWEENMLHNLDWDSFFTDLGLPDHSIPGHHLNLCEPPPITHIPDLTSPNYSQPFVPSNFNLSDTYSSVTNCGFDFAADFGNCSIGFDFIEELIRAAECFDSNELEIAEVILARLSARLRTPAGKPLQRAAFYFKEALQSLLSGSNRPAGPATWFEIVQSIKAHKAFSGVSPIPMFSHFTANQALLEAFDGSTFFHVIDFDIGFGCQYASFMKEIAETCSLDSPVLRISAVVPDEFAAEKRLIKENLSQFAQDLKIGFQIEFVQFRTFQKLSFNSIKFMEGEKTAVLLAPAVLRRLGSMANISAFLGDERRVCSSVVVFVDGEGWMESGATSFRMNIVNGLEFYSMMFESLEATMGGSDLNRKIEMSLLRPAITEAVEAARRRVAPPWREVFEGAGMKPVQLSRFADFQAESLLGKVQVRGFHVVRRQAELILCWHERALVATSAWKC